MRLACREHKWEEKSRLKRRRVRKGGEQDARDQPPSHPVTETAMEYEGKKNI